MAGSVPPEDELPLSDLLGLLHELLLQHEVFLCIALLKHLRVSNSLSHSKLKAIETDKLRTDLNTFAEDQRRRQDDPGLCTITTHVQQFSKDAGSSMQAEERSNCLIDVAEPNKPVGVSVSNKKTNMVGKLFLNTAQGLPGDLRMKSETSATKRAIASKLDSGKLSLPLKAAKGAASAITLPDVDDLGTDDVCRQESADGYCVSPSNFGPPSKPPLPRQSPPSLHNESSSCPSVGAPSAPVARHNFMAPRLRATSGDGDDEALSDQNLSSSSRSLAAGVDGTESIRTPTGAAEAVELQEEVLREADQWSNDDLLDDDEMQRAMAAGTKFLHQKLPDKVQRLTEPTGPWILHPHGLKRLILDTLGLICIVGDTFIMPLSLAFDVETADSWFWSVTVFFLCDIVSQFCTGYYLNGILVMRQSSIVRHYVTGFFFLDFFATVPLDIVLAGGDAESSDAQNTSWLRMIKAAKMLRMLRLLRVVRVKQLVGKIEDVLPSNAVAVTMSIVKTVIVFAVLCHWTACTWGFLGNPDKVGHMSAGLPPHAESSCEPGGSCEYGIVGSPWIRRYSLERYDAATRYLVALQFSAGLLTGNEQGYEPGANGERIYFVIMVILSFLICSVILSNIVSLVGEIHKDRRELKLALRRAKDFMTSRKVPVHLQAKVKQYLEYLHEVSVSGHHDHMSNGFLDRLSPWIRLELTEHMNGEVLQAHPFFQKLPRPLLKRICGIGETVFCAPGDVIVQKGHRATSMFFLIRGRLRVKIPKHVEQTRLGGKPVYLDPPSWVGDKCLFIETTRSNTVHSVSFSELLTMTKELLLSTLDDFPRSKKYYLYYQKLVMDGQLEEAGLHCEMCGKPGHAVSSCPMAKTRETAISRWSTVKSRLGPLSVIIRASNFLGSRSVAPSKSSGDTGWDNASIPAQALNAVSEDDQADDEEGPRVSLKRMFSSKTGDLTQVAPADGAGSSEKRSNVSQPLTRLFKRTGK